MKHAHTRIRTRLLAVVCVAFCAVALARPAWAEMAGQVLVAVGDVLALREGRIVRLVSGAAVESGDQIRTGADSYVRIRFTDWGLIAIRPRSDFIVDEYFYERRQGGRQRAFFSLLKGGIRALTGSIGHANRAHFRVRASTATIGIRGTHFSLLFCELECRNSDGGIGVGGLYGSVIEGRIAVSPFGGGPLEREFGAGEFFHLADANSVPAPLPSLPPFFRDGFDEQARSPGEPGAPAGSVSGAVTGITGGVTDLTGGVATGLGGTLTWVTGGAAGMLTAITAPASLPLSPGLPVGAATGSLLGLPSLLPGTR